MALHRCNYWPGDPVSPFDIKQAPPPFVVPAGMPGRTLGMSSSLPPTLDAITIPNPFGFPGRWRSGSPIFTAPVGLGHPGNLVDLTIGAGWFSTIHVLPRGGIDFGSFVSPKTATYEVFSAYGQTVTLTTLDNPLSPGVALPSAPTPPATLLPYSSLLDPSSTPFAPVKLSATVGLVGPATFDDDVEFDFDTGDVRLIEVSGTRVPLLRWEPDGNVVEHLEFATDVIPIAGGKEQRASYRDNPRQIFEFDYIGELATQDRRAWANFLFARQSATMALPLWHESAQLSASVSIGQVLLTVPTTIGIDFRIGGLALVYKSPNVFDVGTIIGVSSTQVAISTPVTNAYAKGDYVMPLRLAQVVANLAGDMFPANFERWHVRAQVLDNETGAMAGDLSGYHSLNGRLFLDDPNVTYSQSMPQQLQQTVIVVDNLAGPTSQTSDQDRNKHGISIGFSPKARSAILAFRKLVYALRGRLTAFWVPTRTSDLTVTQNISIGTSTVTVENDDYTQYVAARQSKATFRVTFADGTALVRTVLSSTIASAAEEVLTVDSTWPANRAKTEVTRVEWLELVRFDSDDVVITHTNLGRAQVTMPAIVVQDDP